MARFELKQSSKLQLTSYAGLALIGQCCQAVQVKVAIKPKLPVAHGVPIFLELSRPAVSTAACFHPDQRGPQIRKP
ncbi:Putative transposase, IS4 family [Aromatoleum petrolei]|nr:Putative transposase, IS4 family [Aromatoleum petrolei]